MRTVVILGTELKLNVNIPPIDEVYAMMYDFSVELFCQPRKVVVVKKSDMIEVDESNYIVRLDTTDVGVGELKARLTAHIPDEDFPDGLRTEIVSLRLNIEIAQ